MKVDTQHWVLWDGVCGFCRRSVEWAERRDRDRNRCLRCVPYQQAPSPPMTPELYQACARAVHVVTADGRVLKAGRAALFVLRQIGFGPLAAVASVPPFVWMVEVGYWMVARNRMLFSRFMFKREEPKD